MRTQHTYIPHTNASSTHCVCAGPRSERLFVNGPTIERATVMGLKRSLTAPARPDAISQSAPVAEVGEKSVFILP